MFSQLSLSLVADNSVETESGKRFLFIVLFFRLLCVFFKIIIIFLYSYFSLLLLFAVHFYEKEMKNDGDVRD